MKVEVEKECHDLEHRMCASKRVKRRSRGGEWEGGGVSGECHHSLTCHMHRCLGRRGGGLGPEEGSGRKVREATSEGEPRGN